MLSAKPRRLAFDLAAALKVVNYDFDRHSEANCGLVGVVHVAKVYGPEMPQHPGRRCAVGGSVARLARRGKPGGS